MEGTQEQINIDAELLDGDKQQYAVVDDEMGVLILQEARGDAVDAEYGFITTNDPNDESVAKVTMGMVENEVAVEFYGGDIDLLCHSDIVDEVPAEVLEDNGYVTLELIN